MLVKLLMPREVDRLFRYPRGRSLRLAKAGKLPSITLPDGEIRFDESWVNEILHSTRNTGEQEREVANA